MLTLIRLIGCLSVALLATSPAFSQGFVNKDAWHKARPRGSKETERPIVLKAEGRDFTVGTMMKGLGNLPQAADSATTVGQQPPELSQEFDWNRSTPEVRLRVYINAGDPYGVCISNLKKGDVVEITSARGDCRFSRGTAVKDVLSYVVVASALAVGVATDDPQLAVQVATAGKIANEKFVPAGRGLKRDPFGFDSGTGDFCGDEGGVLVCLPTAGGIFHMQNNGHVRGCPKAPRTDSNRPDHVGERGFFPVQGDRKHNTRTITEDGELFLVPWDWSDEFEDNTGYYEVRLTIRRGNN